MDDAVKDEQRRLMAQRRLEGMKRRSEELAQEARRTTQEAEAQAQIRNIRAKALAEMEGRMRVDRCAACAVARRAPARVPRCRPCADGATAGRTTTSSWRS